MQQISVIIHPHALERMKERGATPEEVKDTILNGENFLQNLNGRLFGVTLFITIIGMALFITINK